MEFRSCRINTNDVEQNGGFGNICFERLDEDRISPTVCFTELDPSYNAIFSSKDV